MRISLIILSILISVGVSAQKVKFISSPLMLAQVAEGDTVSWTANDSVTIGWYTSFEELDTGSYILESQLDAVWGSNAYVQSEYNSSDTTHHMHIGRFDGMNCLVSEWDSGHAAFGTHGIGLEPYGTGGHIGIENINLGSDLVVWVRYFRPYGMYTDKNAKCVGVLNESGGDGGLARMLLAGEQDDSTNTGYYAYTYNGVDWDTWTHGRNECELPNGEWVWYAMRVHMSSTTTDDGFMEVFLNGIHDDPYGWSKDCQFRNATEGASYFNELSIQTAHGGNLIDWEVSHDDIHYISYIIVGTLNAGYGFPTASTKWGSQTLPEPIIFD